MVACWRVNWRTKVIKRVSGRAYRYRVESYRDPVTRRVRGKWTYLGRVEGEGTLSPERQARPSSRERLLDAVERLLERHELAGISTGMVASEAALAYGTFYRHFRDLAHVVRDAMIRQTANLDSIGERLDEAPGDSAAERAKMTAWTHEAIAAALARPACSVRGTSRAIRIRPSLRSGSAGSRRMSNASHATSIAFTRPASRKAASRFPDTRSSRWPALRPAKQRSRADSRTKNWSASPAVVLDLAGLDE